MPCTSEPFTEADAKAALDQLLGRDGPVLEPIVRDLLEGFRARPVHTWCPACHRLLRDLLARVAERGTKKP